MTITSGTTPLCAHCGRPVIDGPQVSRNGYLYHLECTRPPQEHGVLPLYGVWPPLNMPGCTPVEPLTEDRVREIVREELARIGDKS